MFISVDVDHRTRLKESRVSCYEYPLEWIAASDKNFILPNETKQTDRDTW